MGKIDEIIEIVKTELASSSHDIEHTFRVRNIALKIADHSEENVDNPLKMNVDYRRVKTVIELASILHDIARVKEDTDKTHSIDHAVLGAEMAESILRKFGYPNEIIDAVSHCISTHRYRGNNLPRTIEAKILSDADKLDAIGAVGVARAFMIAGEYGEPLYKSFDKSTEKDCGLQKSKSTENERRIQKKNSAEMSVDYKKIKNFGEHSPNIEYEVKLKKIPERLYTDFARSMAKERIEFMDRFFSKLEREVTGEE